MFILKTSMNDLKASHYGVLFSINIISTRLISCMTSCILVNMTYSIYRSTTIKGDSHEIYNPSRCRFHTH